MTGKVHFTTVMIAMPPLMLFFDFSGSARDQS